MCKHKFASSYWKTHKELERFHPIWEQWTKPVPAYILKEAFQVARTFYALFVHTCRRSGVNCTAKIGLCHFPVGSVGSSLNDIAKY